MEMLNKYIATLVATLVFMTAIELIAPDNSLKKYLKFILGLILISVLLNPIIQFLTGGEEIITEAIDKYEKVLDTNEVATTFNNDEENIDVRKNNFVTNFNKNCESMLKTKYDGMSFKADVDCDVNFEDLTFIINKLEIGIKDGSIKKIEKIVIDKSNQSNSDEVDQEVQNSIKEYLSEEIGVNKEKIEVKYMD